MTRKDIDKKLKDGRPPKDFPWATPGCETVQRGDGQTPERRRVADETARAMEPTNTERHMSKSRKSAKELVEAATANTEQAEPKCKACNDTGKNSRGGFCKACRKDAKGTSPAPQGAGDVLTTSKPQRKTPLIVERSENGELFLADGKSERLCHPLTEEFLRGDGYVRSGTMDLKGMEFSDCSYEISVEETLKALGHDVTVKKVKRGGKTAAAEPATPTDVGATTQIVGWDLRVVAVTKIHVDVQFSADPDKVDHELPWIGIVPVDTPHNQEAAASKYVWYGYLNGAVSGHDRMPRVRFMGGIARIGTATLKNGTTYHVRLFTNDGKDGVEAASCEFTTEK